jgi:hypothetical protein
MSATGVGEKGGIVVKKFYMLLMIGMIPVMAADADVNSSDIRSAQSQAESSMMRAWQQGSEDEQQPVSTLLGAEGSVLLAQNAPRQIITLPNGEPGLSDRHTTITVIQQPTPIPVMPPQKTSIQTTVNGIDRIETQAVLPEQLAVDQLEAVKKIADNGTLIAQQRFGLEQYKINQDMELEYLRLIKSFVLWGLLVSIPFLFTTSWILKNVFSGYRSLKNDLHDYRLKEQEVSDRVIYEKVPQHDGRNAS